MAVPKQKTSKSRRRHRRSQDKLTPPPLAICSNCNRRMMPHRICDNCGFYRGEKVLDITIT